MYTFINIYKLIAKYRYIIALCIFIPWIIYFDKFSLMDLWEHKQRMEQLESIRTDLKHKISTNEKKYEELMGSDEEIEQFARENFFFRKTNEDVFIIVDQTNNNK